MFRSHSTEGTGPEGWRESGGVMQPEGKPHNLEKKVKLKSKQALSLDRKRVEIQNFDATKVRRTESL